MKDLNQVKFDLIKKRENLVNRIKKIEKERTKKFDYEGTDSAEKASHEEVGNLADALGNIERKELSEIDQALFQISLSEKTN